MLINPTLRSRHVRHAICQRPLRESDGSRPGQADRRSPSHGATSDPQHGELPLTCLQQAHALTPILTEEHPPPFPFLTLLVSGGHTLLVLATSETDFRIIAKSLDDSVGDAFDKTARLLQIPWLPDLGPGPSLEQYALPDAASQSVYESIPPFSLPTRKQLAFSFAGLKTNVERVTRKYHSNLKTPMKDNLKRAMARRFQEAAIGHLEEKVNLALDLLQQEDVGELSSLVVSGGVASNSFLRSRCGCLRRWREGPVLTSTTSDWAPCWIDEQKRRSHRQCASSFPPFHSVPTTLP